MPDTEHCPCGQPMTYLQCCGRYLEQGAHALTAEQLMRSRYTAYTQANVSYLIKTWHPDHCPELNQTELNATQWLRLEVLHHKPGLKKATVEFKAYYVGGEGEACVHERSLFRKLKNRWVYVEALNF